MIKYNKTYHFNNIIDRSDLCSLLCYGRKTVRRLKYRSWRKTNCMFPMLLVLASRVMSNWYLIRKYDECQ